MLTEQQEALAWDAAYERAAELDSPNSPDFDRLHERIYEEYCAKLEEQSAKN
jgi:hypothetical protein